MKTAFCPLCGAGIAVALRDESKKGWKMCPSCSEPSYVEVSEQKQHAIALKDTIKDIMRKPAGKNLIAYLLKNDENVMDDLLFNSSKGLQGDIEFLESIRALNKSVRGYSLNPELKSFLEKYYKNF